MYIHFRQTSSKAVISRIIADLSKYSQNTCFVNICLWIMWITLCITAFSLSEAVDNIVWRFPPMWIDFPSETRGSGIFSIKKKPCPDDDRAGRYPQSHLFSQVGLFVAKSSGRRLSAGNLPGSVG